MNPYEVLGVPDNADEATVKKAYRELVKKYHPDKYVNNPLADLATEKLKAVNEAYDMIMNGKTGSSGSSYSASGSSSSYTGGNGQFSEIRILINRGLFAQAEQRLQSMPKNAEWNFLMGVCKIRTGWYDTGLNYIRTAAQMDPTNPEYQSTLNSLNHQSTMYRNTGSMTGSGCDTCDICNSLICADCCCECMGGDLISCC